MMRPGADTANMANDPRHLLCGPAFTEFFKSSQSLHMHLGIGHISGIIELDNNFRVSFDPSDRLYIDDFSHYCITPLSSCRTDR